MHNFKGKPFYKKTEYRFFIKFLNNRFELPKKKRIVKMFDLFLLLVKN